MWLLLTFSNTRRALDLSGSRIVLHVGADAKYPNSVCLSFADCIYILEFDNFDEADRFYNRLVDYLGSGHDLFDPCAEKCHPNKLHIDTKTVHVQMKNETG